MPIPNLLRNVINKIYDQKYKRNNYIGNIAIETKTLSRPKSFRTNYPHIWGKIVSTSIIFNCDAQCKSIVELYSGILWKIKFLRFRICKIVKINLITIKPSSKLTSKTYRQTFNHYVEYELRVVIMQFNYNTHYYTKYSERFCWLQPKGIICHIPQNQFEVFATTKISCRKCTFVKVYWKFKVYLY